MLFRSKKIPPPRPRFNKIRIIVVKVLKLVEEALLAVPMEVLDELPQRPGARRADVAVLDVERPHRRFVTGLALPKALLDNVE